MRLYPIHPPPLVRCMRLYLIHPPYFSGQVHEALERILREVKSPVVKMPREAAASYLDNQAWDRANMEAWPPLYYRPEVGGGHQGGSGGAWGPLYYRPEVGGGASGGVWGGRHHSTTGQRWGGGHQGRSGGGHGHHSTTGQRWGGGLRGAGGGS